MIVYNETYLIDEDIHEQWLQWIKANHVPAVLNTGTFSDSKILKVLNSPNEGITYCVQFYTEDPAKYEDFMLYHLNPLSIAHNQAFENRFVVFNTLMQQLD
ncbi:DUF4286 family protein [Mucilaginibacter ginkgonis]|uniref:DUF4286 family protein n=1 Tax=Mucilaginibacter ginkgonis TaxID=2682091 RepID=A0A7T7FAP6_9SPHI|nr:DUF4286 family protein [Mucilaginibacter ginkgonis]QQL49874.1 DUF4286 family protein [Mucilaginibacter ginkgonis]